MSNKKIALFLLFCFLSAGQVFAAGTAHKVTIDHLGNLDHYWIATSTAEGIKLKLSKSDFTEPQTLYGFTQEVLSFDIAKENTNFYLTFASNDASRGTDLYLVLSRDNGLSFSSPLLISPEAKNPSSATVDNQVSIAWEGDSSIYFITSQDSGRNFEIPCSIQITGEVLSSPSLAIDNLKNIHLAFLSKNTDINLNKIVYTRFAGHTPYQGMTGSEPRVLYESHDEITNPRIKIIPSGILVFWQKEYMQRRESYFSISLDGGKTFSKERLFDFEKDLLEFGLINGKPSAVTYADDPTSARYGSVLTVKQIDLQPPPAPQILFPADKAVLPPSHLKLTYALPGDDRLLCVIDLSPDENFNPAGVRNYKQITSPTQEVMEYCFPEELEDGNYFLKVYSSDGINTSASSQHLGFTIDSTSPQILSLEAERIEKNVVLQGKVSEFPSWLSINEKLVTLESSVTLTNPGEPGLETHFECQFPLEPGNNLFTLILTDEAGNQCIATEEVYYNPACPEITVVKPEESKWFKPDSTIFFEARVFDVQNDIEDGTEARVTIGGMLLEETLAYDQPENMLFGFITLPSELTEGKHTGAVVLSDKDGNEGRVNFAINIDGSPPVISQTAGNLFFSNSEKNLEIPVTDAGSGIDLSGSLIKISNISLEGTASLEGEKVIFISDSPLSEGSYEVEVFPRDLVGNVGAPVSLCLIVDTTPPKLALVGSYESQTSKKEITLQAHIEEEYPVIIKIYNNQSEIENFQISGDCFSRAIKLIPGNNDILIEASDQAGNTDSASIQTYASFAAASDLIADFRFGPNPFSPTQILPGTFSSHGKGMVFSYNLSQAADIKIFIFDLSGTLIWTKEIKNAVQGITPWNGIDQFGRISKNGVYPYIFSVSSGDAKETRRGKIIIYQP